MYGNSRFRLLSIDGVAPSRATITKGQYTLEDYYYAVIRKDTPADSPARKLIDWLLTDSGQAVAVKPKHMVSSRAAVVGKPSISGKPSVPGRPVPAGRSVSTGKTIPVVRK